MPVSVVVCERACDFRQYVRPDGLIKDYGNSAVGPHAKLPRIAASLDSAVIRRGISRPPEPRRDREVRGRNGNRGSRDSVSCIEVPRQTDFISDSRRARNRHIFFMYREYPLLFGSSE